MAKKVKGRTYIATHKSPMGLKRGLIIHAPTKEEAEKVANEYYPNAGKIKVKRHLTEPGAIVILPEYTLNSKKKLHESTESMAHTSETAEENTLSGTFTHGSDLDHEDD